MNKIKTVSAIALGCAMILVGLSPANAKDKCVQLSLYGKEFVTWAGSDIDIFEKNPVCYSPTDMAKYDNFFDYVTLFTGDVRIADAILQAEADGKTTATNGQPYSQAAAHLLPLLEETMDRSVGMVQTGKQLSTGVHQDFTGLHAYKAVPVSRALTQSLQNLNADIADGKKALDGLSKLAAQAPPQAGAPPTTNSK
jgi:hypothetical protein